jgi:hypothetical protein
MGGWMMKIRRRSAAYIHGAGGLVARSC